MIYVEVVVRWLFVSADGDGVTSFSDSESGRNRTSDAPTSSAATSATSVERFVVFLPVDDRCSRRSGSPGCTATSRRRARPLRTRSSTVTVRRCVGLPLRRTDDCRLTAPDRTQIPSRETQSGGRRGTNSTSGNKDEVSVDRKYIDNVGEASREQFLHRQSAQEAARRRQTVSGHGRSPQVRHWPCLGQCRDQPSSTCASCHGLLVGRTCFSHNTRMYS